MNPTPRHSPGLPTRDEQTEREEQRADIAAVALQPDGSYDRDAVLTRPALLRRGTAGLVAALPSTVERLVAETADAGPVAAVSLHSGVGLALVEADGLVRGEWHRSDALTAVCARGDVATTASAMRDARRTVALLGHDRALLRPGDIGPRPGSGQQDDT